MTSDGLYITTESMIERVLRVLPDSIDFNEEEIVEHIYIAMEEIGGVGQYHRETITGNIENNRLAIPTNIQELLDVRYEGVSLMKTHNHTEEYKWYYFLNQGVLYSDIEEGEIELEVTIFPTDKRGMPYIPKNIRYILAVQYYIAERLANKMYLQDKLSENKYIRFERDRYHHMMAAKGASKLPTSKGDMMRIDTVRKFFTKPFSRNEQLKDRCENIADQCSKNIKDLDDLIKPVDDVCTN